MTKSDIETMKKSLEEELTKAQERVKTATERKDAVEKELGTSGDLMLSKSLKGDTEDEKQDSFDKCMKEFDEAHKGLKNIGKRIKAFGKTLKASAKEEKQAAKAKTKAFGTNLIMGAKPEGNDDPDAGFDWKGISVPARFKTLAKPERIGFRKAYAMGELGISLLPQNPFVSSKRIQYAKDFISDNFVTKAAAEAFNEQGGAFIPIGFYPFLIELINSYGVARRNVPLWPMKDATLRVPRDSSLLAVYGEDENQANATESSLNSSTVKLEARKYMGTISVPREIIEDSPIAFGAVISSKYAKSMAKKEDQALFLGDGTSTYNQTKGIIYLLQNTTGPAAQAMASLYTSAATTVGSMTRKEIVAFMSVLAAYAAEEGENKIYCSQWVYQNLFRGNALSTSTYATEIIDGIPQYKWDGIPVEITNVMAQSDATSQVVALYGNLGMAAKMGDKRAYALDASDQVAFKNDQIVFRASERIAQTVHDFGTYVGDTSTAYDTPYGPVAAFASHS